MEVGQIHPHIRYARAHNNFSWGYRLSYCYDCRLFFIQNGNGKILVNGKEYRFTKNTAIFLPGGTEYELRPETNGKSTPFLVFDFDLVNDYAHLQESLGTADRATFSPEKVLRYEMPAEFSGMIIQSEPKLYEPLKKCTDEFLFQPLYYRETASAVLKACLLELLRRHRAAVSKSVSRILEYIHGHYQEPELTNRDIARIFHYHPHYASALVKQATGKTLHQYLLDYRIRMAKNELITTDLDISTVAWRSGFNSVSHFIKMFRLQTGVTPGKYRQANMGLGL